MKYENLSGIVPQIKEIRLSKGLAQQQLAEKSELNFPFINLIENNKRNISLETLIKLLDVLDILIGDFFLPYSEDEELKILLKKLQTLPNKDEHYEVFSRIIEISEKTYCVCHMKINILNNKGGIVLCKLKLISKQSNI